MSFAKNADFWVQNNLNVLFRGKHGVGKTAVVINTFNRHKLKWKYFSASTLDPWVDFVGVPREATDENGNVYLDLLRPREFAADEVEAIMIDEYNRGAKKVKNAVMELLQFKSINGKKFNNLKMVWAAINPDDDADNSYEARKIFSQNQTAYYTDHLSDIGTFTGRFVQTTAQMRAILAYLLVTARASSFSFPNIGVAYPFGYTRGAYASKTCKVKSFEFSRRNFVFWDLVLELVEAS